jgi:hypothetical protein
MFHIALAVSATPASALHRSLSCADWAARDGYHPDAPGSYSSYNCDGLGGDYVQVNGRGRYSGELHHTLIHAHHYDCVPWYCFGTSYHVHAHWHG